MDQLERAVARAIEERGPSAPPPRKRRGRAVAAVPEHRAANEPSGTEAFAKMSYSTTRVEATPARELANNRVVAHMTGNPIANVFGVLRTQVVRKMRDHKLRTLAFIGPTAGVGKSTVAVNLAVSIARDANQTIVLVDFDLRRPSIAQYFGITPAFGIGDYLRGDATLESVLVNPGLDRLVLLPGRDSYTDATEMLCTTRTRDLVEELRERYASRYVLFDLPPLLGTADALSFLPLFECALLIVEEGRTTRDEINECKRLLGDTPLVGAVVNKGAETTDHYFYTDAKKR